MLTFWKKNTKFMFYRLTECSINKNGLLKLKRHETIFTGFFF